MGLKFLPRRKSKARLNQESPQPANLRNSFDNSTISSKQESPAESKSTKNAGKNNCKNASPRGPSPFTSIMEADQPPALPTLGLSPDQTSSGGKGGVVTKVPFAESTESGTAAIVITSEEEGVMSNVTSTIHVKRQKSQRSPGSTRPPRSPGSTKPPRSPRSPGGANNASKQQSPGGTHIDPPAKDSPKGGRKKNSKKQDKSTPWMGGWSAWDKSAKEESKPPSLREAMQREISRHRSRPRTPVAPSDASARSKASSKKSKSNSVSHGTTPTGAGMAAVAGAATAAGFVSMTRASSSKSKNMDTGGGGSSQSVSRGNTPTGTGMAVAAGAATAGGVVAMSRMASFRRKKSQSKSYSHDTEDTEDFDEEDKSADKLAGEKLTDEEEKTVEEQEQRTFIWGFGGAKETSVETEEKSEEQDSLGQNTSFWSHPFGLGLSAEGDKEETTHASHDKESMYMDDDASFDSYEGSASLEGSYASFDDDGSQGDLPADNLLAGWFGFGGSGGGNDEVEEETLFSDETSRSEGSYDDDTGSVADEDGGAEKQERASAMRKEGKTGALGEVHGAADGDVHVGAKTQERASAVRKEGKTADDTHNRHHSLSEAKQLVRRPSFKNWKRPGSSMSKKSKGEKSHVSEETSITGTSTVGSSRKSGPKARDNYDTRQRDIYCSQHGGVDTLKIRQYATEPMPIAPDHILVEVEASTVTSRDCVVRLKGDPNTPPSPAVPGFHMVGRVSSVGARVSFFHRGDRVAALLPYGGGNAKYVSIPKESAVLLPKSADHQDIICLVANYMPAYQCLKLAKRDGLPLTNANVLVTGGSGPVGQALVELALSEGANVYATAHKMHEEHLTKLGAKWFGIKPKKWLPYLEGKMDVVIDSLGVDGYDSTYSALNPDGILVCNTGGSTNVLNASEPGCGGCGVEESGGINKWWSSVKARYIWNRAVFYDVYESYEQNPKMFRHELQYLICKLQRGEIRPKVAGKVSLNQVPKAQSLIEAGLPNGTVVCLPWKKLDPKQNVVVENLS